MDYFKKVFKESIIIVIISSIMGLFSGTLLSLNEKIIYAIPIILLILPSLNSLIGDISTWGGVNKKKPPSFIFIFVFVIVFLFVSISMYFLLGNTFNEEKNKEPHDITVVIEYDKPWSGAYSLSSGISESIDGSGYTYYTTTMYEDEIISVNVQKT